MDCLLQSTIRYHRKEAPAEGAVRLFAASPQAQVTCTPFGLIRTIPLTPQLGIFEASICDPGGGLTVRTAVDRLSFVLCVALPDDRRQPTERKPFEMKLEDARKSIACRSGEMGLFAPAARPILRFPANQSFRFFNLLVDASFLIPLLQEQADLLPEPLLWAMADPSSAPYFDKAPLAPPQEAILRRMLECPYGGNLRRLFLESKSLELLIVGLDRLLGIGIAGTAIPPLRRGDRDSLQAARAIIEREYQNPPCLTELARRVGLNTTKLKIGFRGLFGRSVFEHVRNLRLDYARSLLAQGDLDVTRTCYEVGYSSLSHFSKAFRQAFGASGNSAAAKETSRTASSRHRPSLSWVPW
jgi:AraC-like DNA-binding protein